MLVDQKENVLVCTGRFTAIVMPFQSFTQGNTVKNVNIQI